MFELNYYLIVSFSILLFAISKSGFSGGGLALISVTLLSITYGPLTAIAILMPMLIICDVIALYSVSYTHLRAHETGRNLVCRLLLEKKKQ